MIDRENGKRYRRAGRNTMRTALIAAALVLALSVTAYAVGEYTGFFDTVFGDESLAGWDPEHVTLTDENGNIWKEYDLPGQERAPVDAEAAQALVGEETATVDKSVKVQDVTFTVEDIVMDANGMGVLTYTMEDPNGFPGVEFTETGGMIPDPTVAGSLRTADLYFADENGQQTEFLDSYDFVAAGGTDTKKTVVKYFAPFAGLAEADSLKLTFRVVKDPDATLAADEVAEGGVIFPLSQAVAVTPLTGPDGWSADISPVGLQIVPPEGDPYGENYWFDELVIHMTDGAEYVLSQTDPYMNNTTVGCYGENGQTNVTFNRIIDPAQVQSVTALGEGVGYQDERGQAVAHEDAWVEVESKLVGDMLTSGDELRPGLTEVDDTLDLTFTK